jgi:autotransporter family porin
MATNHTYFLSARNKVVAAAVLLAVVLQACVPGFLGLSGVNSASPGVSIYEDRLAEPWQNWSWDVNLNLSDSSNPQTGCTSISVAVMQAWGGLYLHSDTPQSTTGYTHIQFYVNGGSSGSQSIKFAATSEQKETYIFSPPRNAWALVSVPLSELGSPDSISDLYWQDDTGGPQPAFYIDAIALVNHNGPSMIPVAPACSTQANAGPGAETNPSGNGQAPSSTTDTTGETAPVQPAAAPQFVIYDDALAVGWEDWSWDTDRTLINPDPVQSGPTSIAVRITNSWGALYLRSLTPTSTAGYTHLEFYIHGGSEGGQHLKIMINGDESMVYSVTAEAGAWERISIPLTEIGSPASLIDVFWQDATGEPMGDFFLDSIALVDRSAGGDDPGQTVEVTPTPLASGTKFVTLPPGSELPSDEVCAAAVRPAPENKGANARYNATMANQGVGYNFFGTAADSRANSEIAPRVTGNFTGTTDEILQWAACKWGIDEDIVRAQAAVESWWHQDTQGDWSSDPSRCAPGYEIGVNGREGECPESFGILQTRYPYEQGAWPGIANSTAFNADTAYSIWRACYEGYDWWLNSAERGSEYGPGDVWGCVGRWFAGRWHTADAEMYIDRVQEYLNARIWESPDFQEP